jgi:hypothetical protein
MSIQAIASVCGSCSIHDSVFTVFVSFLLILYNISFVIYEGRENLPNTD